MKTLRTYINESILDDLEDQIDDFSVFDKLEIKKFIEKNYNCNAPIEISDKPNKDGKYEVSCQRSVSVKLPVRKTIESLTNDLFVWKFVKHDFDCKECQSLKSLEGAPEIVGRAFYCGYCKKLKSLDGFPKKIGFNNKRDSIVWVVGLNKTLSNNISEKIRQICELPEQISIMR